MKQAKAKDNPSSEKSVFYKQILSFKEALIFLDVSDSFLYKKTSKKEIPFYKPNGGKLQFEKGELILWLSQNKSDTFQERTNDIAEYLFKWNKSNKGGNHGS